MTEVDVKWLVLMKFIDLFAGLGGFHLALSRAGHECAFASEIDPKLQELYRRNFGFEPAGDIREVDVHEIPRHDILCAGFPCQPFSKAGDQSGLRDPRGGLFHQIFRIVEHHRPRFLILENVPNFVKHDGEQTWQLLEKQLRLRGYYVDDHKLSPHRFGIPQIRERIFIVGDRGGLGGFEWPAETRVNTSITSVLDKNPPDARPLPSHVKDAISAWQQFLDLYPNDESLPSFPIWGMEFGATYPFETRSPHGSDLEQLWKHHGAYGVPLRGMDREALWKTLPSYARIEQDEFPTWKKTFIRQNRELYLRNKEWLDAWRPVLHNFAPSFQKFEWNAKGEERDLSKLVLQIRASGVRAKRDTTAPSLVAMTSTQVPIITWEERYMTPLECARLQNMEELELPSTPTRAYAALGNAVNVTVVAMVARQLLEPRETESNLLSLPMHRQLGFVADSSDRIFQDTTA